MLNALFPSQYLLYGNDGYDSHIVRFVLTQKDLEHRFIFCENADDELAQLNPYKTLPILVGKEIALYEFWVIFEYLEERHQAIKLLPATPKDRAITRTLAYRINKDWLSLGKILLTHPDSLNKTQADAAKKTLSDTLITLSPLFGRQTFFLSETLGVCDILLVPFLWRLPKMGIELPHHLCRPLIDYQNRLFNFPSFIKSLRIDDV